MAYIIDRIENGVASCECLETGDKLEIAASNLPKGAKEGDAIRNDGAGYTIDSAFTKQRKAELSDRLDKLFKKHDQP